LHNSVPLYFPNGISIVTNCISIWGSGCMTIVKYRLFFLKEDAGILSRHQKLDDINM